LRESNLIAIECNDTADLCMKLAEGCGGVIISEEALTVDSVKTIQDILEKQEPWSDIPIIVLTSADIVRTTEIFSKSGNISLLERPFSKITLTRSVEVALRARKKQYEVKKLLEDLQHSKDMSEKANVAKTQFLANMSHEIRTPIGAIMGFIDIIKHDGATQEEYSRYIGIIERNSHQLLRIIDDILDLSKVEAGKMSIEKINFSFNDLISDFVSIMRIKSLEKGIEFDTEIENNIPDRIISDPTRLKQILLNIVGNAIKFTNKGFVKLKIRWNGSKLQFIIHDSGIGLTQEQIKRLFQPFSQADSSTTRKFGGTGLGLILSRRLSEELGGNLYLDSSSPGLGSTFVFEIEPSIPKPKENNSNVVVFPYDKKLNDSEDIKILLVEDSLDNRLLISAYLKKFVSQLKTASNGKQGVEVAMNEDFDLILMDIQMPLMDGHQATKKLRDLGYRKPIIALTAHAMSDEKLKCKESGFTDYLSKPLDSKRLEEVVKHYGSCGQQMLN
jgi:signal transduction histidine kinase/CheY-like chemotaxis protein